MNENKRTTRNSRKKAKQLKSKVELIDFDTWFWFAETAKRVRHEQKHEIKVFFSEKGLKDREEKQKFYDTLKLY